MGFLSRSHEWETVDAGPWETAHTPYTWQLTQAIELGLREHAHDSIGAYPNRCERAADGGGLRALSPLKWQHVNPYGTFTRRDAPAAKRFLQKALRSSGRPRPRVSDVDGTPSYPKVISELKESTGIREPACP